MQETLPTVSSRAVEQALQCDPRLNLLTKKAFLSEASRCFEYKSAVFQERDEEIYSTHLQREWRGRSTKLQEVAVQGFNVKELGLGLGIVLYQ